MIATLIGGTGLTGSLLLQQLLADPSITQVLSVSRRQSGLSHPKLTEVLLPDLAGLPDLAPKLRADLYFCCLGTIMKHAGSKEKFAKVDHDAVVAFARIAKAHDAKSFALVSATGANARSMFFYNQVKGRTEDDLQALGLRSLLLYRPAFLAGPRPEDRRNEKITGALLVPFSRLLPQRMRKSLVTEARTLAARMLAEAKAAPAGSHVIRAKDI